MNQTITNNLPKISVVVLAHNQRRITSECIKSILKSTYPNYEIILVDNNSDDKINRWEFPSVRILRQTVNRGYAGGMNQGIKFSSGELIVCLNNDTIVGPSWLTESEIAMRNQTIGCANTKLLRFGTNRHDMSICRLKNWNLIPYSEYYNQEDYGQCDNLTPDYATGCAIVLRKKILNQVGLFDESYRFFWEDVDLSFRIKRAGYKIGFIPKAIVWHRGGESLKKTPWKAKWYMNKNRIKFFLKYWGQKCIL